MAWIRDHGPGAARGTKHDFDFLFGSWKVHNRYLKGRLRGSTEWVEFDADADTQPVLDGLGNLDLAEFLQPRRAEWRTHQRRDAAALQSRPQESRSRIHWADTVRAGTLLPPMIGRFNGDVGEFFGDEMLDGRKVLCRFLWTRRRPHAITQVGAGSDLRWTGARPGKPTGSRRSRGANRCDRRLPPDYGRAQAVPSRRSARGTCFRISFSQRLEHALKVRSSPAFAPSLSDADTMPLTK